MEKKKLKDGEVQCGICGHIWTPNVKEPKACSRCKSYKWKDNKWIK